MLVVELETRREEHNLMRKLKLISKPLPADPASSNCLSDKSVKNLANILGQSGRI